MSDNRTRSKSGVRRAIRIVIICVEVVAMLLIATGAYAWSKASQINTVEINTADIVVNEDLNDTVMKGYTNVALFGLDTREGQLASGVNSDTMIIASVNNESGLINMASLYRDTYMNLGDDTYEKANAAYSHGGPAQALSMINQAMDLDVQLFIACDFKALTVAIDCLGGLDVNMTAEEVVWMNGYVAETSEESGIYSPTLEDQIWDGVHHLNGTQATAFCRIRYTEGDDYKRTERQRYILSLIFEKAKTMDFATLNSIADQVFPLVYTNMTMAEMVQIGLKIVKFNMGVSYGLPDGKVTGNVGKCGDAVVPTEWALDVSQLHAILFGEEGYIPSEKVHEIGDYIAKQEVTQGPLEDDEEFSDDEDDDDKDSKKKSDDEDSDDDDDYDDDYDDYDYDDEDY